MTRWIEETFHPHWRVRLAVDRVLHEVKTRHQHLVIFTNQTWGTVLMLDGVCQLTTSDEFIYHEMMAHVPLMALERPRRVLVVGGGDGGVLREVLKHPPVERVTLCEIDRAVIDLSLKHYPEIADGAFDDKRVDVVIADGCRYVAETGERFDAIIVDSSEPIGPSAALHTREFFTDCKRALRAGGVLVTQNGLPFLFPKHLAETSAIFAALFASTSPYLCTQPCYFGGPFALNWASDDKDLLEVPEATLARRMARRGLAARYYTPAVHRAAFALPGYVLEAIRGSTASRVEKAKAEAVVSPVRIYSTSNG
ncbi:MAG TPA: polyamine aminopropyltransferase [Hyphomicrobiaceae bacterium]|nr:polyamine aminopropyltransferase [Hyphomicrobiaceae bacterium]